MLTFSEDFFKEEIREEFKISETMKHAWAAQLEVLSILDKVLTASHLPYYAFWGTLLGCIRHQGFIPWDDDIDIAMKREDYDKFLVMAKFVLPNGFQVLNVNTNENYMQTFLRITNGSTIDISKERLSRFHGCPFIVGVDIFPLDYLPADSGEVITQKNLLNMISYMGPLAARLENLEAGEAEDWEESRLAVEAGLITLEETCGVRLDRTKSLRNQLHRLYDRICAGFSTDKSSILTSMPEHMRDDGFYLPEEWFEKVEYRKFENIELPVPVGHHEILKTLYGDYMTPVRGSAGHDYPFYREQLEILWEKGLWRSVPL